MKFKIFLTLILTSIFITLSCKEEITKPEEPPAGRRDYVWTVDTLAIPFMSFGRIWGSGVNDIWIVGPGGDLDKTIYHYDGTSWKTDGISRSFSPLCVWGFGKNNVWFGGREGKIWHYDGNILREYKHFETTQEKYIGFQEMWGDSPTNVFAAGYSGDEENRIAVIAQFNGTNWGLIEFPNLKNYNFLRIRRANSGSSIYYLLAIKDEPVTGDLFSIFEYKGSNDIKLIYEGSLGPQTSSFVQKIDDEMYFLIGSTIYEYSRNEFRNFLQITLPNFGLQIFGRNKNDIFLRMIDGIAHYNGNDIEYLYRFNGRTSITDAFLFETEVFFLALDLTNGNDLIFHGKLK
ncbi:MAG: hypothetical protein FD188_172 [Ignavibacteria bacterium]|nr:MAG: hypothetical protein FD188_172 [Ignavibacteria bacterium]